jgi:hypothetical protein
MNTDERKMWIWNDEPLYRWWKSTRLTVNNFIKEYRVEIDDYINAQLNRKPR